MEVEEKPSDPIPEPRSNKDRLLAMGFSPIVVSMAVDENPNTPFDDLIQIALALSTEGRVEELSAWVRQWVRARGVMSRRNDCCRKRHEWLML